MSSLVAKANTGTGTDSLAGFAVPDGFAGAVVPVDGSGNIVSLATAANQVTGNTSLASVDTKTPALGAAAPSASRPVTLPNDVTVTGGALTLPALNLELLTNTSNGWFDAANYHSVSIQIIGSAGLTAGQIIFEQTNDTTNAAAGNVWAVDENTTLTPTPNIAALAIAASTTRMFAGAVTARYVRVRTAVAFTGSGTVQAVAVFSQLPYYRPVQTVHQATAANLNVTVGSGTVTTVSSLTSGNLGIPGIIADVASAALTTTTTTAAFTPTFGAAYEVNIPVTVVSGTTPTLDVGVEESDDTGTNWVRVFDFPRITATGFYRSPKLPLTGNRVRYVQTVAGTTPSFTRAINRLQSSESVAVFRQLIDRSIVLTTLNSATAILTVQGCQNLQMVLNLGAATTVPTVQMEATDDGGATWYPVGNALTGVASGTVSVIVNGVSPQQIRGRVSVAGATVTAGYLLLKGY